MPTSASSSQTHWSCPGTGVLCPRSPEVRSHRPLVSAWRLHCGHTPSPGPWRSEPQCGRRTQTCSCLPSLTGCCTAGPEPGDPTCRVQRPRAVVTEKTPYIPPLGQSCRYVVGPLPDMSLCLMPCFGVCVGGGTQYLLSFSDPYGPLQAHEMQPVPTASPGGLTFLRVGTLSYCWVPRAWKRASQAGAPKIFENEKKKERKTMD